MKQLVTGILLAAMVGCLGGRLYFDKPTRYDIKLSMLKMKKHYELIQQWLDGGHPEQDLTDSVNQLQVEAAFLLERLPDRNPVIWQETIREMQQTLNFMEDSVADEQRDRVAYHFRNLRGTCTDCHVRYRIGFNF